MEFLINEDELEALSGLIHFHQLTYLRGIRPYMDLQTGLVGIKRGISYQSIAEQLYVEPHPGFSTASYSRAQVKRALSSLERVGLISFQSDPLKLILSCPLATLGYFVQNKAVPKPSQYPVLFGYSQSIENKEFLENTHRKAVLLKEAQAVPPLNSNNNYIFLLGQHFKKFWSLYPLKNSEQKAWEAFQAINPSEALAAEMLKALQDQLHYVQQQQALGQWVPNWKNPANWLAQRCWNDVIPTQQLSKDRHHAKNQRPYQQPKTTDALWDCCKPDSAEYEEPVSNVIPLTQRRF